MMLLPLVAMLGTAGFATAKAVEEDSMRLSVKDMKPGEEPPWYYDPRTLGAAGLMVLSGVAGDKDAQMICQAGALGLGASVVSTEVARHAAKKNMMLLLQGQRGELPAGGGKQLPAGVQRMPYIDAQPAGLMNPFKPR